MFFQPLLVLTYFFLLINLKLALIQVILLVLLLVLFHLLMVLFRVSGRRSLLLVNLR